MNDNKSNNNNNNQFVIVCARKIWLIHVIDWTDDLCFIILFLPELFIDLLPMVTIGSQFVRLTSLEYLSFVITHTPTHSSMIHDIYWISIYPEFLECTRYIFRRLSLTWVAFCLACVRYLVVIYCFFVALCAQLC